MPPDDLVDVKAAAATLRTKFLPRLLDLNADQIRALLKFGSASTDFSDKTYAHIVANLSMKPGCVDMDPYTQSVTDYATLGDIMRDLAPIFNQGNDSLKMLGSQKYSYDLACYTASSRRAKLNIPGADLIVADLARGSPTRAAPPPRRRGRRERPPRPNSPATASGPRELDEPSAATLRGTGHDPPGTDSSITRHGGYPPG